MKKTGTVFKGKALPKADVTIILSDETLVDLASGKVLAKLSFFITISTLSSFPVERTKGFHDW